jgi:hypothetical protein
MMNPDVIYGVILGSVGYHVITKYIWPFLAGEASNEDDNRKD